MAACAELLPLTCIRPPTQQKEKLLRIIDVNWEGGVSTVHSCSAESRLERRSKFKLLSAVAEE